MRAPRVVGLSKWLAWQEQEIQELTRMNAILGDQIVQSAGRLEAVRSETSQLKALIERADQETADVIKRNEVIAAEICTVRAQVSSSTYLCFTVRSLNRGKIQALNRMTAQIAERHTEKHPTASGSRSQ